MNLRMQTDKENKNIHLMMPRIEGDPVDPAYGYAPGWYFSDETEGLNGPFPTRDDAIRNLIDYARQL